MFGKWKEQIAKAKEEREQKEHEEQERLEQMLKEEKDRLMALSDKELMVELIIEMKRVGISCGTISRKCDVIEDECEDIARKVVIFGN